MSSCHWLGELRLPRAKTPLPVCSQSPSITGEQRRARAPSPALPWQRSADPHPVKVFSRRGIALLVLMGRALPRWLLQATVEDFVNSSYFCRPAGNNSWKRVYSCAVDGFVVAGVCSPLCRILQDPSLAAIPELFLMSFHAFCSLSPPCAIIPTQVTLFQARHRLLFDSSSGGGVALGSQTPFRQRKHLFNFTLIKF